MSTGGPIKGKHVTDGSSPHTGKKSGPTPPPDNKKGFGVSGTDEVPALGHLGTTTPSSDVADNLLANNADVYDIADGRPTTSVGATSDPPPRSPANDAEAIDVENISGPILEIVEDDDTTVRFPNLETTPRFAGIDLEDPDTWHFAGDLQDSQIDGVAVFFVATTTAEANIVFASAELLDIVDRPSSKIAGQPVDALVGTDHAAATARTLCKVASGESTDTRHTGYVRIQDGTDLQADVAYSAIPTVHAEASYVVAIYYNLLADDVENETDYPVTVDSYTRGSSLGSLCFDIADHISTQLGSGTSCWVGLSNTSLRSGQTLEPLVTMGAREGLVKRLLRAMFDTEDITSARCVLVADLPDDLRELTQRESISSLWGFPALDQDGRLSAAIIVARPENERPTVEQPSPDQPTTTQQKMLTGFAGLIAKAGDRQSAQLQSELATSQALYDQLTRLPNRSLLLDRLEQATARLRRDSSPLAVLMIDIDNFRSINNTYGAELGDEILIEVAARIHNSVRLGDTVGRIGSDQFVLICVATNGNHDVAGLARRISRSISEPIELDDGTDLYLTASIGVVLVEDQQVDPTEIIGQAESAMMTAMQSGRGHYAMFDREHQRHSAESQTLEQALHRAIMNEELLLHYQPVFGLETGQMVGAEALVRWTHPDEGLVSPAAFMDLAEESGLIIPMGDWIINKAAEASASWPEVAGRYPIITVNLSARQMTDTGLVTTIEEALRRYDLLPNRLGFEITESARIVDLQQASATLKKITMLGCRVAIDDFGIGHATLDYLRRFSMASAIKIDRSFTNGLATSREDAAIVAASIAMASALGMQVVAEGVENHEQLRELRELGCDYAQGFLLSRPVAVEVAQKIWLIDSEESEAPLPTEAKSVGKYTLSR